MAKIIKMKDLLKDWYEQDPGPKRWTNNKGLTEFEQQGGKDSIKEGPAYEYANYVKQIEKTENLKAKAVSKFVKVLQKKGFKKEAKNVAHVYDMYEDKFTSYLKELMDKLI